MDLPQKVTRKKSPNKVKPFTEDTAQKRALQLQKTVYKTTLKKKKTPIGTKRKLLGGVCLFTLIAIIASAAFIIFCVLGGALELGDYLLYFDQNVSVYTVFQTETSIFESTLITNRGNNSCSTCFTAPNTTSAHLSTSDFTDHSNVKTITEAESGTHKREHLEVSNIHSKSGVMDRTEHGTLSGQSKLLPTSAPPHRIDESIMGSRCDFEDAIACGYRTNSMEWLIDHGSNNTNPKYDHTFQTSLGRFVRMNSKCPHCRRRLLMSPWEEFKEPSCLRFYYFLAGTRQVPLSLRIKWDRVRKWTALHIPGTYRRYAWSAAQVPLDIKGRAIFEFLVALHGPADDIFIAIDDVEILHKSCPPLDCEIGEKACPNDGICLANFLFCDGVSDCPDGADEKNCDTNTSYVRLGDLLQLPGQGRLELRTEHVWRPLCGAKWTNTEADVACRTLGYTKLLDTWILTDQDPSDLYSVQCKGDEDTLLQCHVCLADETDQDCMCTNSSQQVGISCSVLGGY